MMKTIVYVHGLGGGGDSRIPGILAERYAARTEAPESVRIVCRTYDFDPDRAAAMLEALVQEVQPDLIIGESLGAAQALRIPYLIPCRTSDGSVQAWKAVPHLFVSPSLGAPLWMGKLAFLALIPGIRPLFNHIYKPRPGDRQVADFKYATLKKYRAHNRIALETAQKGLEDAAAQPYFAFFGTKDHYRKSGVVSIGRWEKCFGKDSYALYEGTHFMEEEYIDSMLIPRIDALLHL
ncbi:MAG: hypothetical protein IJR34_04505 [Bacteroidales bacterium]|nr:hypothetical protein [Bacteroidales bacterium]MBQ9597493.1 hypothetical protein [Bacteroidales bacterium]